MQRFTGCKLEEFHWEYWVNLYRRREVKLISFGYNAFENLEGAYEFLPQLAAPAVGVQSVWQQVSKVSGTKCWLMCLVPIGLFLHYQLGSDKGVTGLLAHLLQQISLWFPWQIRASRLDVNAGVVPVDKEEW